jgi:hypothetical protein
LVNRRRFAAFLVGATLAGADNSIEVGGATIEVSFDPTEFDLPGDALMSWVRESARAVSGYFAKFPVSRARIRITQGRRAGVGSGRTFGEGGARTRISIGQHTTVDELKEDWMMTHEMVHYGFPSVEERHHWIEEGTATYVEPIARVRIGQLTPERVWGDMIRDMPQGLPEAGDQGLNNTHTWGRTYWGGAIFCLLADVRIRKQSGNKKGLEDALRGINRAGGTIEVEWPLARALEVGDQAVGGTVLRDLFNELGPKPVAVDLADLWKQLGVSRNGREVTFDDQAPLSSVRRAILGR